MIRQYSVTAKRAPDGTSFGFSEFAGCWGEHEINVSLNGWEARSPAVVRPRFDPPHAFQHLHFLDVSLVTTPTRPGSNKTVSRRRRIRALPAVLPPASSIESAMQRAAEGNDPCRGYGA